MVERFRDQAFLRTFDPLILRQAHTLYHLKEGGSSIPFYSHSLVLLPRKQTALLFVNLTNFLDNLPSVMWMAIMNQACKLLLHVPKCHFLSSCDRAGAVCSSGQEAAFDATKQEVTLLQPEGAISRLDPNPCKTYFSSEKWWISLPLIRFRHTHACK